MKRVLLPVLSIFMVMAVLVNTAGITVYNHFCLEEGESSLAFSPIENCCIEKKDVNVDLHGCCKKEAKHSSATEIKKPGCCHQKDFSAQWNLNECSFYKNILIDVPEISIPVFFSEFKINLYNTASSDFHFSPPLLFSSRQILHLHSILLI